tara:strand:- start:75 stop:572 length:498 start_codon:yes stop_codon:yes gene_type:complete
MNNNINTLSDSSLTTKQKLSFLWIFAVANYIFCDFTTLLNPESLTFQWRSTGVSWKDYMEINPSRILSFAIVMQLPIMMIPLSVFLPYKSNRIANITIGLLMTITIGLLMTIFLGLTQFGEQFFVFIFKVLFNANALHFIFFSITEIATTLAIIWIAFNWSEREI